MTLIKILLLIAFSGLYIGFVTLILSLCKMAKIGDRMFEIKDKTNNYEEVREK